MFSISTWVGRLFQDIVSVGSVPLCISRSHQDIVSVNIQTLRFGVEYTHQDALQKNTHKFKKKWPDCDFLGL